MNRSENACCSRSSRTISCLVRQEREALRHAAEEARQAAEEARHATIAAVAATAETLSGNLAQMQFLEDARNTLTQLLSKKPGDAQ
jgi:hypothetical protein